MIISKKYKIYSEFGLLGLLILAIFIAPAFPTIFRGITFSLLFSLVFFACALSIAKRGKAILWLAASLTIFQWVSHLLDLLILNSLLKILSAVFFMFIVVTLIAQTVKSKKVTASIIVGSVNGYLLLGLLFSMMVGLIYYLEPNAYNFKVQNFSSGKNVEYLSEFTYYSFITLTTVGYGDFIPLSPIARSISILISTAGQLYLTILIALLVGKFISSENV